MAILYRAHLSPTKKDLLAAWVPAQPWAASQPWAVGATATLELLGAYRFDDPAGEVGMETHIVRTPLGRVLQVPLTYRDRPLEGQQDGLVGTAEHSVLGRRWVYNGCSDPVYAQALVSAILTGGTQADQQFVTDAGYEARPTTTLVQGSGQAGAPVPTVGTPTTSDLVTATVIRAPGVELTVVRVVEASRDEPEPPYYLKGTWPGQDVPVLLATAELN